MSDSSQSTEQTDSMQIQLTSESPFSDWLTYLQSNSKHFSQKQVEAAKRLVDYLDDQGIYPTQVIKDPDSVASQIEKNRLLGAFIDLKSFLSGSQEHKAKRQNTGKVTTEISVENETTHHDPNAIQKQTDVRVTWVKIQRGKRKTGIPPCMFDTREPTGFVQSNIVLSPVPAINYGQQGVVFVIELWSSKRGGDEPRLMENGIIENGNSLITTVSDENGWAIFSVDIKFLITGNKFSKNVDHLFFFLIYNQKNTNEQYKSSPFKITTHTKYLTEKENLSVSGYFPLFGVVGIPITMTIIGKFSILKSPKIEVK
jgi:hypothetical protein